MQILPCADSSIMANRCEAALNITSRRAQEIALMTSNVIQTGQYDVDSGKVILWDELEESRANQQSIHPDAAITSHGEIERMEMQVQVRNETTLAAAWQLQQQGLAPLVLNFANGFQPGGNFLNGEHGEEQALCRNTGLFSNLLGQPMYLHHLRNEDFAFSDWIILSPLVPVFRDDCGAPLHQPWSLDIISCAAPISYLVGQSRACSLLQRRVYRILDVARAHSYQTLVLGAWGCGNFENQPVHVAKAFLHALEGEFAGCFKKIIFAIADWSPQRCLLGPFARIFQPGARRL